MPRKIGQGYNITSILETLEKLGSITAKQLFIARGETDEEARNPTRSYLRRILKYKLATINENGAYTPVPNWREMVAKPEKEITEPKIRVATPNTQSVWDWKQGTRNTI